MRRCLALIPILILFPAAVVAQAPLRASDAILDALGLDRLLVMLQEEAVASAADLGATMLPDAAAPAWERTVTALNAPERIGPRMRESFAAALDPDHVAAIRDFVTSPLGARIAELELSARAALNAPDIEAAVLERDAAMRREGHPRVDLIDAFIRVNDLIDANVVGALNANAAFLAGLREAAEAGGAPGLPQGDIAGQVWQQEPEIRAATRDWVRAFTALAYQPLSEAEFRAYLDFSRSPAGQALNTALFAAFDAVFVSTSYQTGAALARAAASQEL